MPPSDDLQAENPMQGNNDTAEMNSDDLKKEDCHV